MNRLTDPQLLRDYTERHSEAAFTELVRRHVDLVYSAALRMVCDAHLAEDVTQGAFVALAQNARQLTAHPVLSGWLHRTAQNLAAKAVRSDVRRRAREQEAATMNELLSAEPNAVWEHIAPHLDAALGELGEADRDALLLRYFERKSASEMATTLGISDEAAQKRVSRAVERLRELFAKRGITVGASGLVVVIYANGVQAAPIGLAITISTTAALAGTTLATTTAKAIAMTTLQKTLITAMLAIVAGVGIHQTRHASLLRAENQTLRQKQVPLADQVQRLQKERDGIARQLSALKEENEKLSVNTPELLRLRGEVGMLRLQRKGGNAPSSKELLSTAREYYERAMNSDDRDFEFQLDDLNKAIQMDPSFAEAYSARATLYANKLPLSKGGHKMAVADLTRYLELQPDDLSQRFNRAISFNQLGENDSAIIDFTTLIQQDDDIPRFYLYRGMCYAQNEDYSKAIADYTASIRLDPHNKNAYRYRGQCYEKIGQTEKAQQDFATEGGN
ncbi:MAG: sigma-70 family RNA polymerase sigma factor [Verrucomicrobia subdivision 3 bacterium]|nr:sigma-70 family RNA polymerase sigma factor [Limisphaerales bacterium]